MMKKIILSMMAVFLMGSMVMAQHARRGDKMPDPKVRAERMTERMVKEYSLNDTQKKQLLEANLAMVEKVGDMPMTRKPAMRRGKGGDKCCCCCNNSHRKGADKVGNRTDKKDGKKAQMTDEQRAKMKAEMEKKHQEMQAARTAYSEQLQKIMTKDQYAVYSQNQQKKQMKAGEGRKKASK